MKNLVIYSSSVIAAFAENHMGDLAEINHFCRNNRVEVLFFDDRMAVCCGVKRTYKVPKSVNDMSALTKWIKGRIEVTENKWKKTDLYKIMHR